MQLRAAVLDCWPSPGHMKSAMLRRAFSGTAPAAQRITPERDPGIYQTESSLPGIPVLLLASAQHRACSQRTQAFAMSSPSAPYPEDAALDAEDRDAMSTSLLPSPSWSSEAIRFLLPSLGDTEDLERYAPGGLHPVSLGDVYDERYRVVHKLGAGGFSTVWLARDDGEQRWVALKIVVADHSVTFETKNVASQQAALRCGSQEDSKLAVENRRFTIDGPNGRHLCLVLPVLGPSVSQVSCYLSSRITPRLARKAAYQAAQALANLHAQGLCHGGKPNVLHSLARGRALLLT